ncbi:MAG: hypothetical protein ACRDO8_09915 [Nocardioidaceae bacterium]
MGFMNRGIQNRTVANVVTFFVVVIGLLALVLGIGFAVEMVANLVGGMLAATA